MALIVVFDEGASPEAVLEVHRSVDEGQPVWQNRTDILLNPDLSSVSGIAKRYLKHFSGAVVEMSQAEKDAVDAAIVAVADEQERLSARDAVDNRHLRAIAEHFHARCNSLGDTITAQQMRDDILSRIDNL